MSSSTAQRVEALEALLQRVRANTATPRSGEGSLRAGTQPAAAAAAPANAEIDDEPTNALADSFDDQPTAYILPKEPTKPGPKAPAAATPPPPAARPVERPVERPASARGMTDLTGDLSDFDDEPTRVGRSLEPTPAPPPVMAASPLPQPGAHASPRNRAKTMMGMTAPTTGGSGAFDRAGLPTKGGSGAFERSALTPTPAPAVVGGGFQRGPATPARTSAPRQVPPATPAPSVAALHNEPEAPRRLPVGKRPTLMGLGKPTPPPTAASELGPLDLGAFPPVAQASTAAPGALAASGAAPTRTPSIEANATAGSPAVGGAEPAAPATATAAHADAAKPLAPPANELQRTLQSEGQASPGATPEATAGLGSAVPSAPWPTADAAPPSAPAGGHGAGAASVWTDARNRPTPKPSRRTWVGPVVALVAAGAVGGATLLAYQLGWLGDAAPPAPTEARPASAPTVLVPSVLGPTVLAPPSTAEASAASVAPASSAAPGDSAAPVGTAAPGNSVAPMGSAAPAATATPSDSAAPAASTQAPSSAPPTSEADAALTADKAYVVVQATEPLDVYIQGNRAGKTGDKVLVLCGPKFLRVGQTVSDAGPGRPPQVKWRSDGKGVVLPCKQTTTVTLPLLP